MLADMQMRVDAARLLTYRVAVLANGGDRMCEEEASMAKAYASEAYFKVATDGMQLLGGYANDPQLDMERYFARFQAVDGGWGQLTDPAGHHSALHGGLTQTFGQAMPTGRADMLNAVISGVGRTKFSRASGTSTLNLGAEARSQPSPMPVSR